MLSWYDVGGHMQFGGFYGLLTIVAFVRFDILTYFCRIFRQRELFSI